jgi:hypothetical protein
MIARFLASAAQPAESTPDSTAVDSSTDSSTSSDPLAPAVYLAHQEQSSAANPPTNGVAAAANEASGPDDAPSSAAHDDAMTALLEAPKNDDTAQSADSSGLTADGVDQALAGESDWKV